MCTCVSLLSCGRTKATNLDLSVRRRPTGWSSVGACVSQMRCELQQCKRQLDSQGLTCGLVHVRHYKYTRERFTYRRATSRFCFILPTVRHVHGSCIIRDMRALQIASGREFENLMILPLKGIIVISTSSRSIGTCPSEKHFP